MTKDEFFETIRFQIITNELKPGQMLNEKEFMSRYGIGRSPLREVLVRLQQEGLIQTIPRMGSMVTRLEINEIREIMELRKEMEGVVGRLAAQRITPEQLEKLKEIVREGEKASPDGARRVKISTDFDTKFHNTLYDATHNRKLKAVLQGLQLNMVRLWYHMGLKKTGFLNQIDNLKQLVAALERHDAQAAQHSLEAHIDYVTSQVKDEFI